MVIQLPSKFTARKFLSIVIQLLIFAIVIGLVFFFVNNKEFSFGWLKKLLFPFGSSLWWYATVYLLLYLLSPLLNIALKTVGQKLHLTFIIIFLVIWSILPTLLDINYAFSNLGWFITIYFIGSYIRLYGFRWIIKPALGILLAVGSFVVFFFIRTGLKAIPNEDNAFLNRLISWFELVGISNMFQLFSVLVLFISFSKLNLGEIKPINIVASATFSIYLLHDHPDIRQYLWIDLFKNNTYAFSPVLIPYSIGVTLLVFVVCLALGLVYKYVIESFINKFLNWADKKFLFKIDNLFNVGQ